MSITIDALYEAYMNMDTEGDTPFAEDIFNFFGKPTLGGMKRKEWAGKYSMYFPTWDPSQINLAGRERDLAYRNALNTLQVTGDITDRVYTAELDTLSTALGKELSKGRDISSKTGIRSGDLEGAIQDTITTAGANVKDVGDRVIITKEDTENKYNSAMVETALDFQKTERDEKEAFYDRTMAAIMKLMETGAFDEEAGCNKQCENCELPLICNHCTGECQTGETPPGWEAQIGPCTEGMQLSGCQTYGDKCFCPEVIADQSVTTDVDAFGCACSKDAGGAVISCADAEGNSCEPDWSTSGSWCDQHNDDCGDPASCKYPCADDVPIEIAPDDFSISGGCTSVPSTKDCCSLPQSAWPTCWGSDCSPTCYSNWDFSVVDCGSC